MDPKHITRTSFCDKQIDNVTDNSMKKYILDNLFVKTGIRFNSRYAKVYNEQYRNNLNNPHLICIKSSGTPYLLFCTQINDVNYCFLIDKKIKDGYEYPKIFIVHYRFSNELFQGTLFETELIRTYRRKSQSLRIRLFLKSDPIIGSDFGFFSGRVSTGARFSDPKIEVTRNPGSGKNFFLFEED